MKVSEFRRAVDEEFGEAQGRVLTNELVIDDLGGRTAQQALDAGVPTAQVWLALCDANDVPEERRHGRGLPARSR
ncbi:DUF3046 domain-containing protein [Amnibacterium sp. CER49]|uniref:DUF3046 domain-containing protein n=1 Tax=Amnibacterium sp. CER49 TaxID=3039161 RepID=UPI00244D1765|nr:DUF3046 domain-containing protein [Amnibacterium sp. CER49]MDH2444995.1 DUF3046 domain-containing protein [Amnibacterium sp. CER49]